MDYTGWFGFDSIPVLTKTDAELQKYFLTSQRLGHQALAQGRRLRVAPRRVR